MKKLWFVAATLLLSTITQAQLLKRIGDRAKQKVNQKIDQKVDKTIDDAMDGKKKPKNSTDSSKNSKGGAVGVDAGVGTGNPSGNGAGASTGNPTGNGTSAGNTFPGTLKSYSKFDFVPGDKVISFEDFQQDAIGDFPAKWNTNSSGEVVTVEGQTGHWLMLKKKGRFVPEFINNLPDNFTMQFDIIVNEKFNYYSESLDLLILSGENTGKVFEYSFIGAERRSGVKISFDPTNAGNNGGICHIRTFQDGSEVINNDIATKTFDAFGGKTRVNVSIWRQKQRIRVYLNEEKVFDLPRAFAADKKYNTVLFDIWNAMANDEDRYLVNNIKLAVGAPDTRSKLITEGKFVTSGILFDVNSDRIRPESYGVLKDIANVLTENAGVKVKVIGHTDSDGDDKPNMDLSKRRAEAVKNALSKEFGIDAARMEADGKGESQPADKNDTPVGKANNRRVEFIKL
jgi:outer membrane protein OmpA-like peptidoglycan-associated protein